MADQLVFGVVGGTAGMAGGAVYNMLGLVREGVHVVAQQGWGAVANIVTAAGITVANLPAEDKAAVYSAIESMVEGSPSGNSGNAKRGPLDPGEAYETLGFIPKPLPSLINWPFAVTFDLWYPVQPWNSHTSPFLNNVLGAEDMPTYAPDGTWQSPTIPLGSAADIAFSEFKWPLGPTLRPYAGSMTPEIENSEGQRDVPIKAHQAWKIYRNYRQARFMIEIAISQHVPCRSDVYCALFVPYDLLTVNTNDISGAIVQGSDWDKLPPCARTQASLNTSNAAPAVNDQSFTASAGMEAQQARLDACKACRDTFCAGIVKFPASTWSPMYTEFTSGGVIQNAMSLPVLPRPRTQVLGFNVSVADLMAGKGVIDEFGTQSSWTRDSFMGTLSYRPVNTGSTDETPFRYGCGATTFATDQVGATAAKRGIGGCRLIWFALGPSTVEDTTTTGHDQTTATILATSSLGGSEAVNTYITNAALTGLREGSFRVKSRIGHQIHFFNPRPDETEASMGIGTVLQI